MSKINSCINAIFQFYVQFMLDFVQFMQNLLKFGFHFAINMTCC